MTELVINLGYVGHKAETLQKLFPAYSVNPNEDGYFLRFENYSELVYNKGVIVHTNAFESEDHLKDRLFLLLLTKVQKEYRIYLLNAFEHLVTEGLCYSKIESWNKQETLPEEAFVFIRLAEQEGTVYTDQSFVDNFNLENVNTATQFVFRTNKY